MGRRPVLIHGCINVALCSLGCATAANVSWLIVLSYKLSVSWRQVATLSRT